ncbi:hypothetical protein J5N97_011324 [Dioscorea zingiberensis]|uniref:GDSL esterase/lipase n=1 Tax=Dioscorea zingiberensis TaxID=325984 RepID=A0A9D5D1T9_9LILI|nr:hypothetical protein J5N97_011324 [Dioscorea zingiberensis]
MFVFGDSLSDVGNNNYIDTDAKCNFPHYGIDYPGGKPTGRCSNGKNVVDLLGVNFASGSAGIFTSTNKGRCIPLETQIYYYSYMLRALGEKLGSVHVKRFISSSIFYINIGSNDIPAYAYDPIGVSKYVKLLISTLEGELKRILKLGARKLVFMGTQPIGCWPAIRLINNRSGDCYREFNQVSYLYNEQAALLLKELQLEYADMSYSFFNSYRVFDQYINHPKNYGFDDSKAACCGMGYLNAEINCKPWTPYCSDRTKYVFWDSFHETEAAANLLVSMAFNGLPPNVFPVNVRELSGLNVENADVIQFIDQ